MARDRPVASVSGRQDWAWNRWQAEVRSGDPRSAARASPPRDRRASPPARRQRPRDPDRRDCLETELERTERRYHTVVEQYERLLDEKDRQLTEERDPSPDRSRLRDAASAVARRLGPR